MVKKPFITLHSRRNCLYDYQHVNDSMATMIKSCVGVNITVPYFSKMTRLSMLHEKSTFELSIRLANAWNVMFYFFLFFFPIPRFSYSVQNWLIFTLSSFSRTSRWDTVHAMNLKVSKHAKNMKASNRGRKRAQWRPNLNDVQWTSNEWCSLLVWRARYWLETIIFLSGKHYILGT